MAGNLADLVQMIATLSGVQAKKRELDLNAQQLQQQATQFAQLGEENKFTSALKLIAGSSSKTREGLTSLIDTLAPQHREAAMAFLSGQPIDPTVTHAQDIQAGQAAMSPGQLATVQNEAATQNATGMNVGQMAGSQLGGVMATGAIPQVTPAMTQGYAERAATGRSPIEAAVQQQQMASGLVTPMARIGAGVQQTAGQAAQIGLGYANVNLGYGQLDQAERKMAADYGLDKMLKEAEAQHYVTGGKGAGLTGQAWLEGMQKLPNILNDINKNTSDKAGNMARIRVYNSMNAALGAPVPMLPIEGEGSPSKVGVFQQFMRGMTGGPTMPWPTMGAQP